jgi:signal peptidase I
MGQSAEPGHRLEGGAGPSSANAAVSAVETGGGTQPARHGVLGAVRELALVLVIALGLSLLIKTFFVQAFFIPSESMENTLLIDDRIMVSKLTPGPFDLQRGDIVVFRDPGGWLTAPKAPEESSLRAGGRTVLTFVGLLPPDSGTHLVKRVIGLPGDRVACCDAGGRVTVNGTPIEEPYLRPGSIPSQTPFDQVVPADRLWVMGDNRQRSGDSRLHPDTHGGTVPVANVVGRAFVTVWPLDRFTWLDRPSDVFTGVPEP